MTRICFGLPCPAQRTARVQVQPFSGCLLKRSPLFIYEKKWESEPMPLPIISVAQMRAWEKATWDTGQTEEAVISRVGHAIAQRMLQLTREGAEILILAGKGHNGDDARATLPHLTRRNVTLLEVIDVSEALAEFNRLPLQKYQFIIEGLFGIGLNRPLDAVWQKFIERINQANVPIVAVDVPSGLNADSGTPEGAAIRASITLTIGAPKSGLLRSSAIPFVGQLEALTDVGLISPIHESEIKWTTNDDFRNFPPRRPATAHKGSFGHVAIIAGSLGYHGAAILSARGALRAQPGLVSVFTQDNVYLPVASQMQAAMVHPWRSKMEFPASCTAIVMGPGLASPDLPERFINSLQELWSQSPLPVLADASALDWLPKDGPSPEALRVITPHPGEAARMLGTSSNPVQSDRMQHLQRLSGKYGGCLVVLKGHQTLIGRSTGDILVNSSGNPYLAQGGSGDVLSGFIGGLLAQPSLIDSAEKAVSYGVWRHGVAADELSQSGQRWSTEDLAGFL
jgi:hydroxyethylthiazole kinase-like uncharacterized protein yjeF